MLCREIVGGHRPPLQWANDIRLQAVREQIPEADVAVIGGGNAALCAALVARESGASVVVLECAPVEYRGGNSRHTRNMRCMHEAPTEVLTDAYTEKEYLDDLQRVTGGNTSEQLARLIIRGSFETTQWMTSYGVRFQRSLEGTLHLGRTNAFFLGGGKALMNAYYAAARKRGIGVLYNAEVEELHICEGRFKSGRVLLNGEPAEFRAKSVVVASGGFEANLEWLERVWGEAARNFIIRGTPYNKGRVLKLLLDQGAEPVGDPKQCHAVAIDGRAPKFDGGIVTRLDCVPLGIVVNKRGDRFYDEGEDLWPKRYAIWGRLVAQQPDQIAYSIIDSKAIGRFMPSVFPPISAQTIPELARALGLPLEKVESTVRQFNLAVRPGRFDHQILDDCRTEGLDPPKSHWAQTIDRPPFYGYPLRPGITFTYLGVKVNERAEVQGLGKTTNVFAAGEIMAGNVLGKGYLAGFGMTIGSVFGHIAGREAARAAGC
ncbi:MAG: FAD-dependent tricarballylate dehydrogenase TcuA [Acidobacteria bacterium]|nr:MAG: FAD-dependent tricarballylate dehydrogenase TcuA [Acidobacteriota bacterium]